MSNLTGDRCDKCGNIGEPYRFRACVSTTIRSSGWIDFNICKSCFKLFTEWMDNKGGTEA